MIEAIFGDLWWVVVGVIVVVGGFFSILDFFSEEDEQVKEDVKCPECGCSLVLRVGKGGGRK